MTFENETTPRFELSDEHREKLSMLIRSRLVSFLGFDDLDDIGPEDAFADLGTDSRQAVEFKILLERMLDCRLRTTVLFEYPNVARLVDYLVTEVLAAKLPDAMDALLKRSLCNDVKEIEVKANTGIAFPLSETQRGLWYISETLSLASGFHVPLLFRLRSPIDPRRFNRILIEIARRHPILRTRFELDEDGGQILQHVMSPESIQSAEVLESSPNRSMKQSLEDFVRQPFDLTKKPPIRSCYGRNDSDEPFVLLVFHHIVMDGLSAVPFVDELWRTYLSDSSFDLGSVNLTEDRMDDGFFRYLHWETEYLAGKSALDDFEFWKSRLSGVDGNVGLIRTATKERTGVGCQNQLFSQEFLQRLSKFSDETKSPVSTVLLAVYFVLLSRIGGREDLAITSPVSGRPGGQRGPFQDCFGSFINLIVTRCRVDSCQPFLTFLHEVRQTFLEGVEHGQLPFSRQLIAAQKRLVSGDEGPFPISYTYQNIFEAWGENPEWKDEASIDFTLFQEIDDLLTLEVYDFRDSLQINWKYQRSAFADEAIQSWSESYLFLLEQVLCDSGKTLSSLELGSPIQIRLVNGLYGKRNESGSQPNCTSMSLIERLDRMAAKSPSAIAVVQGELSWSYRTLVDTSAKYETELRSQGKGGGTLVPIEALRSPETIAKIIGVLRAGAAYLPIDPNSPIARNELILADAGNHVEKETAYVLYTSGTTGVPKGVPIHHAALLNLCDAMIARYELNSADRVLQFAALTFDMSIEEIFPILCVGGTLVLREEEDIDPFRFANLIKNGKVTVANLPPSYHQALSALGESARTELYRQLRMVSFGGDSLSLPTLTEVQSSGVRVFNAYGPTETTVNATVAELTQCEAVHIGSPLRGVSIKVIDGAMRPLPLYSPGELCISGLGVSKGYIGHAKDSNRFVESGPGGLDRFYRTGDQAYLAADGNVRLMGRVDDQINLRGHRIEPGEVEAAICSLDSIQEAAVVLAKDRIVAFYRSSAPVEDRKLKSHLQKTLPAFMIPSVWIAIEALPLNDRGKLDRKRLVATAAEWLSARNRTNNPEAVETIVQSDQTGGSWRGIQATLQTLLDADHVALEDNFYDLGGHSLLAIQVVARLNRTFGIQIPLRVFLAAESFRELMSSVDDLIALRASASGSEPRQKESVQEASLADGNSIAKAPGLLSPSQARLWFLNQFGEGKAYKIPAMAEVSGALDLDRVRFAAEQISNRHASLRTRFANDKGRPKQIVADEIDLPFAVANFLNYRDASYWLNEQVTMDFDLETGPLLRIAIATIDCSERDSVNALLLVCMHHIISDGWSMQLWVNEFQYFYDNATLGGDGKLLCKPLPELTIQYPDYARTITSAGTNSEGLDYWKKQLDGYQEVDLLTDFPRPDILSDSGSCISRTIPAELNQHIRGFCRQLHVTPSPFWLSAIFGMLRKRGSGNDICFGVPVAGRNSPDVENLIGFFVNTIILRLQIPIAMDVNATGHEQREPVNEPESLSVQAFVKFVSSLFAEGLEHQNISIEEVFSQLEIERRTDRSPVFQVLFSYAAVPLKTISLDSGKTTSCELRPIFPKNETAKFELTFSIQELAEGTALLSLEYASSLFSKTTIEIMLDQMLNVAQQMVRQSNEESNFLGCLLQPISTVAFEMNAMERVRKSQPPTAFLSELERIARTTPDHLAIVQEDDPSNHAMGRIVTYAELWNRVEEFATNQLSRNVRVLDTTRGGELICQCVESLASHRPFTFHDEYSTVNLPADIAYVLSTSGSSGQAKGVAISKLAMDNHNAAFVEQFRLSTADRIAQYATPTFDLFIEEVFPALRVGATIVIVPETIRLDLKRFIGWVIANRITVLDLPTAVFHALVAEGTILKPELGEVRLLIVGGETLSYRSASAFLKCHSKVELWNTYGPTEGTIICSVHRVVLDELNGAPAIGRAFANSELMVVDPDGYVVPRGVAGELVIAGDCLATGYIVDQQLRSSWLGFRQHPVENQLRAYWTGDRVRVDERGNLIFIGRVDDQLKIRGTRVEPSEIAAQLRKHPKVRDTSVLVHRDKQANSSDVIRLIAAIEADADLATIREELAASLPAAMRPTQWIAFDKLPITVRGKIDKKEILRLAQADWSAKGETTTLGSVETTSQSRMRGIWNQLLGHNRFSIDDDFFQVGGHSLLAAQWIYEIDEAFQLHIAIIDAFRFPTIRRMATHLESQSRLSKFSDRDSLSMVFSSKTSQTTNWTVVLPGLPGLGELYRPLAELLAEERNVIVLTMSGYGPPHSKNATPLGSIGEMAQRWFDSLEPILDGRPVDWIAHSYSGTVLYELLRMFGNRLPEPASISLLDCWPHETKSTSSTLDLVRSFVIESIPGAENVVRASLDADAVGASEPLDVTITLVIAQSSREWLDASYWTNYFRHVESMVIDGDHFSIARPLDCKQWMSRIGMTRLSRIVSQQPNNVDSRTRLAHPEVSALADLHQRPANRRNEATT